LKTVNTPILIIKVLGLLFSTPKSSLSIKEEKKLILILLISVKLQVAFDLTENEKHELHSLYYYTGCEVSSL